MCRARLLVSASTSSPTASPAHLGRSVETHSGRRSVAESAVLAPEPLVRVEGLTIDFWSNDRWNNVVNDASFELARGESARPRRRVGMRQDDDGALAARLPRPGSRIRSGSDPSSGARDLAHLSRRSCRRCAAAAYQPRAAEPDDRAVAGPPRRRPADEAMSVHDSGRLARRARAAGARAVRACPACPIRRAPRTSIRTSCRADSSSVS